jgi:gluconolactonase
MNFPDGRPSFTKSACLASALAVAACTSSNPTPASQTGGTGTTGAAGSTTGSQGTTGAAASTTGSSDTTGAAGSTIGTAGIGTSGAGSAGSASGAAGDAGTAGSDVDGGSTDANAGGDAGRFHKQFSCPSGPFPAQKMGATMQACAGFNLQYSWAEGPTWVASQNAFFFSNFVHANPGGMAGGDIIKVDMNGQCSTWVQGSGTNGLAIGADGNIVGACHKTRSVTEFDINTKQARIVANMYMGKLFDSPNDIVVHSNGTIYFTNPTYELGGRPGGFGPAAFRIDPMGVVTLISQGGMPNGIGLSPDEKKLYIVQGGVWNLDDNGVPTTMIGGGPNADGFSIDCAGNIIIQGTNSAFGGPDGKTLIVVSNPPMVKLIQMTVPGLP